MEPHSILNLNERVSCFVDFMKPAARIVTEDVINKLYNMNFFTAPAAIKHHGNYTGGLFDHSLAVTETLLLYTEQLELEWNHRATAYCLQHRRSPESCGKAVPVSSDAWSTARH